MTHPSAVNRIPPHDVLCGIAERTDPRLSPCGRRVAFLAPIDGALNLWVADADDLDEAVPLTQVSGSGLRPNHGWSYDGQHILYALDEDGDELFHVYAVHVGTGVTRDLTPYAGVHAQVVGGSVRHPGQVIVAMNLADPTRHDYYRVSVETGDLELVLTGRNYLRVFVDDSLRPRCGIRLRDDGTAEIEVLGDGAPRTLRTIEADDALPFVTGQQPGLSSDGTSLYLLTSAESRTVRLVRVDLHSGELTGIVSDPEFDVEAVFVDADTRLPLAACIGGARKRWAAVQEELLPDLDAFTLGHRGDVLELTNSLDGGTWLATFADPAGPTAWELWDRFGKQRRPLFIDRPRLADHDLGEVEPFEFMSRDGLTIRGYLTFPPGSRRRDLPAVFYVHGGPWGRDGWWWDPSRQLIATRGYLCVQVNFRGSTGYGRAFLNAGDREWGGRMQDDLLDALDHLTTLGWIDPARVAIYGGSYGGYAALVGATFTPDTFCAAIAWVPPVNLVTLIKSFPPYWSANLAMWKRRVGDPEVDEDFLLSRSPITRAGELRIPLLLVQGENDPRCPVTEAEQLIAELRWRAIPHTYVLVADEGHGFLRPENNIRLLGWIEDFLGEHLSRGVPAEPEQEG